MWMVSFPSSTARQPIPIRRHLRGRVDFGTTECVAPVDAPLTPFEGSRKPSKESASYVCGRGGIRTHDPGFGVLERTSQGIADGSKPLEIQRLARVALSCTSPGIAPNSQSL